MKKCLFMLLATILSMGIFFAGCNKITIKDRISEKVNIIIPQNSIITFEDTHGGFLGDGTSFAKIVILDEDIQSFLTEIIDKKWNVLPLREDIDIILYGGSLDSVEYSYFLADEVGMPKVENGYWFLNDRHQEKSEDFLKRNSFNFTLAVFDTDTNILYVYELDT